MSLDAKVKKLFVRFFWGMHPESALRYLPVVSEIKKRNLENSKILEVGSGSLGITPYFKRKIDGVDVDFSGPSSKYLIKKKGQAYNLPFGENFYDVAISVDVLEHIIFAKRERAIYELLRISKKLSIIVVPVGWESQKQDLYLRNRWKKIFSGKNQFLEEHVENGLPETNQILDYIERSMKKLGRRANIKDYRCLNLAVRKILMLTWISRNRFSYYLYMKGLLLLVPVLRFCNFGTCYRHVFVIEFLPIE